MEVWGALCEGWEDLGRESKGKRGDRGQRGLCGLWSFVTQRHDFAYVSIDGSRMCLSAATKVWRHNGWVVAQRCCYSRTYWKTSFGLQRENYCKWNNSGRFHRDTILCSSALLSGNQQNNIQEPSSCHRKQMFPPGLHEQLLSHGSRT